MYASALVWEPQGGQVERLGGRPAAPVHGDIVLAKLAPGQVIEFEAHAVKGIGKVHAKWSPVATASYSLLPAVTLLDTFVGEEADALKAACPMGVFDVEDIGKGTRRAVVARPRDCTTCRECLRPAGWSDRVALTRVMGHYIFSVESTGGLDARVLVGEALKVLTEKAQSILNAMDEGEKALRMSGGGGSGGDLRGPGGLPFMAPNIAAARNIAAMKNPEDEEE